MYQIITMLILTPLTLLLMLAYQSQADTIDSKNKV